MATIIDILLAGDPAAARLTRQTLMDEETPYVTQGWIDGFLERFDPVSGRWGGGIYGPKWISTFYTMRDLFSLGINPQHPIFQRGLDTLLEYMWNPSRFVEDDICVVAMLASLMMYGQRQGESIDGMIDYLLTHRQTDGGWNCDTIRQITDKSSIHTTLSVLEALADYQAIGRLGRLSAIAEAAESGRDFLLRKRLFRRESDQSIILPYITQFHFPTRWKYDVLRALLYFASTGQPFDPRMTEALNLLQAGFAKGYLGRGTTWSGRIHFKMETGKIGQMNTLRGLVVLKSYDQALYEKLQMRDLNL
jgi:hypothetical protein